MASRTTFHRAVRVRVVLAAVLMGMTSTGQGLHAQGLSGTTLQPVGSAETVIGDLLEHFVGGGGRPKGAINRVVVTEDSTRRVSITVSYTGLENCRLTGEARGRDRRRQPEIQVQPVQLAAADGDATLALTLQPSLSEAPLETAYLLLTATSSARGAMPMSRLFVLRKAWPSGRSLSTVVLEPIGTAAQLGPRPDYAPPPKVLVPMITASPAVVGIARPTRMSRDVTGRVMTPAAGQPVGDGGQPQVAAPAAEVPPAVKMQRQRTIAQTTEVTAKLPPRGAVMNIERFKYGIRAEDQQGGALGPSPAPIELLEGLRAEDINLNASLLLNIASSVYPDRNPGTGIFYYHPRAYHLEWTPEAGHGLRILYGAATASGNSGDVLMAARLQSGLDLSEVQLATDLLGAYVRRTSGTVFKALRPLPLEKEGVDVSLAAVLGQYSIAKEKIAVTGLSDVLGEIEVSWVTDPITKENLQLALAQDVGVNGLVSFAAAGGALAPQVPIAIQLTDRDSFGRVRWSRTDGYRNPTPYPIRLRYLHALVIDPRSNLPILYSWTLGNAEVAPQGAVQWDAAKVPAWIDTEAKRIWVDYSVVRTCDECDRQVLDAITGGVTSVSADQITFHTITPLADVGGYELTAHVRSNYFDPKDRSRVQKSVVLKADNQDFIVRPIYAGGVASGEPLFEYLLELAMPDGTVHRGTRWIPSDGLRVLVGRAQVEQSLGALPGARP